MPFLIGYWIGSGEMAALAFAALGTTLLVRQVTAHGSAPFSGEVMAGICVSTAVSAVCAYFGGRRRTAAS